MLAPSGAFALSILTFIRGIAIMNGMELALVLVSCLAVVMAIYIFCKKYDEHTDKKIAAEIEEEKYRSSVSSRIADVEIAVIQLNGSIKLMEIREEGRDERNGLTRG
jgi:uncharacterized ion transporter superfamily protein YfcC